MSTLASESTEAARPADGTDGHDALAAALAWLVESAGYDPVWLRARVRTASRDLTAIVTPMGVPYLWIATDPGDVDRAEAQLRLRLERCETAGLGVATDGATMRALRRRFEHREIVRADAVDRFALAPGRAPELARPLGVESARLFFEISSIARDEDGLHADAALDELCKLLRAKLASETSPGALRTAFAADRYATTEEHAAEIRGLCRHVPCEPDREETGAPALSSTALALCARKLAPFTLRDAPVDAIGRAFESVLVPAIRAGMGQYFTPDPVVRLLVAALDPDRGETIVDPFCGSGRFLYACHAHFGRRTRPGAPRLLGVEKSPRMARILAADAALREWSLELRCADALAEYGRTDGLAPGRFDVVVTNPPFGSSVQTSSYGDRFALARRGRRAPLEWLALERSVDLLRPGGRIGIVLPYGIVANRAAQPVRSWLAAQVKLRAIVSLPAQAFAPHGAAVRTALLLATRRKPGERTVRGDRAWLAQIDALGYDSAGNPEPGGEIARATSELASFLRAEGW